jgi:hypothetical protein
MTSPLEAARAALPDDISSSMPDDVLKSVVNAVAANGHDVGQHDDSPHGYVTITVTLERLPELPLEAFLDRIADIAHSFVENPKKGERDIAECYVSAQKHACLFYQTEPNERHD